MADKVNITDVKFLVSWVADRLKGNSDAENCKRGKTCRTFTANRKSKRANQKLIS